MRRKHVLTLSTVAALAAALLGAGPAQGGTDAPGDGPATAERPAHLTLPGGFKRLVVIYE